MVEVVHERGRADPVDEPDRAEDNEHDGVSLDAEDDCG
jgi:hypothetical protein